jgi:NTP pyrophosphatase (non-canonical NTP hydrolase)
MPTDAFFQEFPKWFNDMSCYINEWAHRKGFWSDTIALCEDVGAEVFVKHGLTYEDHTITLGFTEVVDLIARARETADRNDGEMIALWHSELSEALEALRHGNPTSDVIDGFTQVEEELADLIIRIMDTAYARKWRLGEAIVAKMAFNETRPYKHNKEF